MPEDDIPSDGDLKQMFMYNEYWDESNAILLYPKEKGEVTYKQGSFISGGRVPDLQKGFRNHCGTMKASVLNSDTHENSSVTLDDNFGSKIFLAIKNERLL